MLSILDGRVVFDVQERIRWEVRDNNFDFNSKVNTVNDDNWFEQRLRIGMLVKVAPWLRIYAQAQDSREWLSDRADIPGVLGAEGDDPFDLRQAYVEFGDALSSPLTLKIGRQILSYGDERLVGGFDWNNISRTFDAVKLSYKQKTWSLDAFASTVVTAHREGYNQSDFLNGNETEREQIFSGLYFSTTALDWQTTDAYLFHLHQNNATPGETNFFTLGLRAKSTPGKFGPFDYEAELAAQAGKVKGKDLTAFASHVGGGYTFNTAWKPRLGLEYNFASGDSDPKDGDVDTFQNLFPTNHKFYGIMDVFSWQNMHELALSLKASPCKSVTAQADFHTFWLANTDDSWYRANGVATVRPLSYAARSASNYAGSEADLIVTWNVRKELQIQGGYSHFFAGSYLSDTGPSSDANFGYLQAILTF